MLFLAVRGNAGAQNAERKLYSVAFYNLENLFDTIHDAGKNDYEFLPTAVTNGRQRSMSPSCRTFPKCWVPFRVI